MNRKLYCGHVEAIQQEIIRCYYCDSEVSFYGHGDRRFCSRQCLRFHVRDVHPEKYSEYRQGLHEELEQENLK